MLHIYAPCIIWLSIHRRSNICHFITYRKYTCRAASTQPFHSKIILHKQQNLSKFITWALDIHNEIHEEEA